MVLAGKREPLASHAASGQVENQHFGILARRELDPRLIGDGKRVTGREFDPVDGQAAARHVHPGAAAGCEESIVHALRLSAH